tara:strand:+ start:2430 stop:3368 length:939 start_codon:yes stop_codon:yes gene_type:complete
MVEKRKIISDILGYYNRRGDEHLYHCPFCDHHKKKLSVNFQKGYFKCWVCDTRGKNLYRIVRKFGTYEQRQKWLELDGRLDLSEFDKMFAALNDEVQEQTIDLPEEFTSLCNKHLPRSSKIAFDYLLSRGVTKSDILRWKGGYCDKGRYSGRIVVPSFNNNGFVNYFIARSYVGHKKRYLNPPCGRDIIFNELYLDWDEPVTLVEGVFDAMIAGDNSIPLLGSTLREDSKLFQAIVLNDVPVYLGLDPDADKKTRYMIKCMLKYDIEVYRINLDGCEDIGSITRQEFIDRRNDARIIDHDEFFLIDELRRVI